MKRSISMIIVVCILMVLIAGCTSVKNEPQSTGAVQQSTNQSTNEPKKTDALVSDKLITLKALVQANANQGPWKDYTIFKNLEKITNVHIEFTEVREGWNEKKNLALATGDLPDIFLGGLTKFDEDTYGPQGVFIKLNEYIDKYGPNIKTAYKEYPLLEKASKSFDGNIYAFGMATFTMTMGSYKVYINKKMADENKIPVPQTVDEFYNALVAFSKIDKVIPMTDQQGYVAYNGWLMPAFGETYGTVDGTLLSVKDGKVVFTPTTEGYKQYLMFLRKLYKEKLLDNTFISHTLEEYVAKTKTNLIAVVGHPGQADYTQYQALAPLTSQYNSKKLQTGLVHYDTGCFAITKTNKFPVESFKWADLFHRNADNAVQGFSGVSFWIGQQGVDWDYLDSSKKTYKYLFTPDEGLTEWLTFLKKRAFGNGLGLRVLMTPPSGAYQEWVAEGNKNYSFPYQDEKRLFPPTIRYQKNEVDELNVVRVDIETYVKQMQSKFIVGEETFDKWDNYVSALKKMNVDKFVQMQQVALDRYNK